MTRGKLLDSDTQLFIFISILIMTKLHPRDPENRQQNRFSERRFSKKKKKKNKKKNKQTQPVEWETGHYRRIIPVRVRWLRGKESSHIRTKYIDDNFNMHRKSKWIFLILQIYKYFIFTIWKFWSKLWMLSQ